MVTKKTKDKIFFMKGNSKMFFMMINDEDERSKVERLFYKYKTLMHREAYKILKNEDLAEDAVTESFIRIMKNLHKIDEDNEPYTRSFLVTICRNVAKSMSTAYYKDVEEYVDEEYLSYNNGAVDNLLIANENVDRISKIIDMLDDKYKDVFIMRRVYEMEKEEIARIYGISAETVRKRVYRAKHMIIDRLRKEEHRYE